MPAPANPTKHIPKTKEPIGWVKGDRKKVKDPVTGNPTWTRASGGLLQDYNGKPTQKNFTKQNAKKGRSHHVRMGNATKTHPKEQKQPKQEH